MSAHSVLGVGLVSALFIAGCNGSSEGPTPAPAPTTTTAPTTTAAPTTTIDPVAAEEAAVSEAAKQARLARTNALINLDDPAALQSLEAVYIAGSPAWSEVDQSLEDLRTEGWRARAHDTIPETLTVEQVTFLNVPPATEADVIVCVVDSGILFEPNAGPDGGDVIVNDVVSAFRSKYRMVKDQDVWKLFGVEGVDRWVGEIECPAS